MKANHNQIGIANSSIITGQKFSQRTKWKQITTTLYVIIVNTVLDKNLVKEQNESKSQPDDETIPFWQYWTKI